MNNPMVNFQQFMGEFQKLAANPQQYVMQRFGIPKEIASDPNAILQNLMNSGKVSQEQINAAQSMASQIQRNPMFAQIIKK
jgi:hypothetical protein